MNYLAHIYLAQHSDKAMLGALLGDFVKLKDTALYHPDIQADIQIHRQVDSFTDSHPIVLQAKALFQDQHRRYSGILLDIFYDHVLSQHWPQGSPTPRAELIQRFYAALQEQAKIILPDNLQAALPRMLSQDWLGSYHEFDGVRIAVERTSQRLSKNGDLLRAGLDDLQNNYDELSKGFQEFFPELIQYVAGQRVQLQSPS
ncbi:ACP phosphodiesterase [Undibacterium pigrum]|uniref:Acyl carrier protein phosphodiesterase n=1 Tax=Undibacterium pigrum TaxID=401470 RepID=A0A318J6R0_9BURK|nr:ACP phosphodiesterase [Undibacterium pigrum]PXX42028.1 acyl carrier protein phosphodiesterase [Undibacterium pigrum]